MLPEEIPVSSTPGRLVRALASMAVAVFVANLAAAWYLPKYTPNLGYRLIREKWEMALEPGPPADWVLVGDSTCNQGLDPAVIRERTGEEAVNLCTIGSMLAVNDAWILEAWIANHGAPKRVIMMHAWDVWSRDHDEMPLSQVPRPPLFWEHESPALHPTPETLTRYALERWVPIYGQRTSLARAITERRRWFVPPAELEEGGFLRVMNGHPEQVRKDGAAQAKAAKRKPKISRENREALDTLMAMSDRHGFSLHLAPGPVWDALLDDPKVAETLRRTRAGLSEWEGQRVHVLGDPVPFADFEMENADHVLGDASRRLTEIMVDRALAEE